MATTFIAQPQDFTPAYNECKFIVNSTNKNLAGFRYIFEVFEQGTANRIGFYKSLPSFGTGHGEQDLSKLLSNFVSWDFYPEITTFYDAEESYFNYDVKVGEEFISEVSYTASLTADSVNVRVTPTTAHTFIVGDQVNITQADGGVANPGVEGLHTVIGVTGTASFVINALFAEVTDVTIDGDVKFADNRKTIVLNIVSTLDKFVFNGVQPWIEMPFYDQTDFELDGVTKQFLTEQPTTFSCTPAQDLWLNIKDPNVNTNPRITFISDDGSVFRKTLTGFDFIKGVAVGPNNFGSLTLVSGTAPLVKPTTKSYEMFYSNGVFNTQKSVKYKINIDRRILISESHILFLDRLGSWSSFAFQLKTYEKLNITRQNFNKDVPGFVSGGEWQYETYEQGLVNFNTKVTKTIDLNTNFMTENEGIYFQQLVTSPQTFVKNVIYRITEDLDNLFDESGCIIHIPESTEYVSCNVINNTFDIQRERNKHLIKQSITIRLSNNDMING